MPARRVLDRAAGRVVMHLPPERLSGRLDRVRVRAYVRELKAGGSRRRQAMEIVETLLASNFPSAHLLAINTLNDAGRTEEAQAALDRAAVRWPDNGRILIAKARAYVQKEQLDEARKCLRAALDAELKGARLDRVVNLAIDLRDTTSILMLEPRLAKFGPTATADDKVLAMLRDASHVARLMDSGATPEAIERDLGTDTVRLRLAIRWAIADANIELLQRIADHVDPDILDVWTTRRVAIALRRAGELTQSTRWAERVVRDNPHDTGANRIVEVGHSSLAVLRSGWVPGVYPAEPSGEADNRTVTYLLHNSLPHASAGYATRTHGLLSALTRDGWNVHAATRLGYPYDAWAKDDERVADPLDDIDGVHYHRFLDGKRLYPKWPLGRYLDDYIQRVVDLAKAERVGVLHAASNHWNGFAAAGAARRLGLPCVYEVRGLWELTRISREPTYERSELFALTSMLEAAACHEADHVLAITHALRAEMIERGVPADKISVLPNGVDSARFVPRERDEDLARELGLSGKTVIGYVGSILDYEGIDTLMEAVAQLRTRRDDFRVLIVGAGAAYDKSVAVRDQLGLQDLVTFTGRVPHEDVERYYSLIDIAPFPRQPLPVCEIVSPLKPFEAMAMGKVAVVSSVAALTEIVTDGDNGLVYDKHDTASLTAVLDRAVDDADLRARLGANAREWVIRERDWQVLVSRLEGVYAELLARPAKAGRQ